MCQAKAISACSGPRERSRPTRCSSAGTPIRAFVSPRWVKARRTAGDLPASRTTKIDQNYLDIDADAATVITRFDGDLSKFAYLKDDVINAAYQVQRPDAVAVVGVGGGRDILSALSSAPSESTASRSTRRSSKCSPTSSPPSPAISTSSPASRSSMPRRAATSIIRPTATTWCRSR